MSCHEVRVVKLPAVEPHPNADQLGLVTINGFTVVVRLDQWKEGDLAVFVEPDYVVSDLQMFAFLGEHKRIKTRRFRGVWSMGLLVPARVSLSGGGEAPLLFDDGGIARPAREGDNIMEQLGIVRYEPEVHSKRSHVVSGREVVVPEAVRDVPRYDLENLRKNRDVFAHGELVVATEKIHGANARYTFRDGQLYIGSRTRWVEDDGVNSWSQALIRAPWVRSWCEANEGWTLFGEIFGKVQSLDYGLGDAIEFRAFDAMSPDGKFMDAEEFHQPGKLRGQTPPVLYYGPYDYDKLMELAEGKSAIPGAKHIREGIVVKPYAERWDRSCGRVALKLVSNAYLAME